MLSKGYYHFLLCGGHFPLLGYRYDHWGQFTKNVKEHAKTSPMVLELLGLPIPTQQDVQEYGVLTGIPSDAFQLVFKPTSVAYRIRSASLVAHWAAGNAAVCISCRARHADLHATTRLCVSEVARIIHVEDNERISTTVNSQLLQLIDRAMSRHCCTQLLEKHRLVWLLAKQRPCNIS